MEAMRLRVKDVEFARREILVHDGKGRKDRVTTLPVRLVRRLREQLEYARELHRGDLADGWGAVWLPSALGRKYRNAAAKWGWQYVFPSATRSVDPRDGDRILRLVQDSAGRSDAEGSAQRSFGMRGYHPGRPGSRSYG